MKDLKEGQNVSISLYNLEKKYGGVKGLAQSLKTNLSVSLLYSKNFRPVPLEEKMTKKHVWKCNLLYVFIIFCRFGSNKLKVRKMRTLWEMILENFEDTIL